MGNMIAALKRGRQKLEDSLTKRGQAHILSLARFRLHRCLTHAIREFARGNCLDAGSGRSPFESLLLQHVDRLTNLDVEDRSGKVDILGDIQAMPELAEKSFDTILCSQVLEHVPRPWDAMREFSRLLKPGGALILSVPHLSVIHEAPHDYYRYTQYGLAALCEQSRLQVVCVRATGGLGCFLLHGASTMLMSLLGGIPLLGRCALWLNYLLLVRLPDLLEDVIGLCKLYPCDYLLIARKETVEAGEHRR